MAKLISDSFLNWNILSFTTSVRSKLSVLILNHEPTLPTFTVQEIDKDWSLKYQSSHKLCYLAIGLLKGSAEHFGKSLNIKHQKCMHYGEEHCQFDITLAVD